MVTRIKQLLEWQQLSPTQFADRIGVGRPVVSHILSERNKPSLEVVQRIIAAFPELSLPWLLSGVGNMLAAPGNEAPTVPANAGPAATLPAGASTSAPAAPAVTPSLPAKSPASDEPRPRPASFPARHASGTTGEQPPRFRPGRNELVAPGLKARPTLPADVAASATGPAVSAAPPAIASPLSPVLTVPTLPATPASQKAATSSGLAAGGEAVPAILGSYDTATPAEPAAGSWPAGLGEPGKAIRRIVIFYRDGSFADYQPE